MIFTVKLSCAIGKALFMLIQWAYIGKCALIRSHDRALGTGYCFVYVAVCSVYQYTCTVLMYSHRHAAVQQVHRASLCVYSGIKYVLMIFTSMYTSVVMTSNPERDVFATTTLCATWHMLMDAELTTCVQLGLNAVAHCTYCLLNTRHC